MPRQTSNETVPEKVEEKAAATKPTRTALEPKYAPKDLRAHCTRLFGVSTSTFDGAMHGHPEKEYTKEETRAIIDKWLYGNGGN